MDDDAEAAIAALAPLDRLSLLIGRVAQADVSLEHALRQVWIGLTGFTAATFIVPADFGTLHQQCKVMIENDEIG